MASPSKTVEALIKLLRSKRPKVTGESIDVPEGQLDLPGMKSRNDIFNQNSKDKLNSLLLREKSGLFDSSPTEPLGSNLGASDSPLNRSFRSDKDIEGIINKKDGAVRLEGIESRMNRAIENDPNIRKQDLQQAVTEEFDEDKSRFFTPKAPKKPTTIQQKRAIEAQKKKDAIEKNKFGRGNNPQEDDISRASKKSNPKNLSNLTNAIKQSKKPKKFHDIDMDVFGVERQREIDQIDKIIGQDKNLSALSPVLLDDILRKGLAGDAIKDVDFNAAIQKVFEKLKNASKGLPDTPALFNLNAKKRTLASAAAIIRDPKASKEAKQQAMVAIKNVNDFLVAPPKGRVVTPSRNAPVADATQRASGDLDALRDKLPTDIVERTRSAQPVLIEILKSLGR